MRISVDRDDPGYRKVFIPIYDVFLNGNLITGICVTADEEKGEVIVHIRDSKGFLLRKGNEIYKTRLKGDVKIKYKEPSC